MNPPIDTTTHTEITQRVPGPEADLHAVQELHEARRVLLTEIEKRIVGQKDVVDSLLVSLFARGHCLFVGVPGLAKTLLISTVAEVLDLSFNRIQFTPDLMPSDITGTDVLEEDHTTGRRTFRFVAGPIFANLLLADEINRTPPKTQAALLQAMQEYRVTAGGETYPLDLPFLVFATQNPIEQEGTYPLPEAQLDRFMFYVNVSYPSAQEELEIVRSTTVSSRPPLHRVLSPQQDPRAAGPGAARPGRRPRHPLRGGAGAPHPPRRAGSARLREGERLLGRRPARQPVPHPRRQEPSHPRRPHGRQRGGRPGPGQKRARSPGHHELPRRVGGGELGADRG